MRIVVSVVALLLTNAAAVPSVSCQHSDGGHPKERASDHKLSAGGNTQFQFGASRIRGRVFRTDTNQPLRQALIRASGPELRGPQFSLTDSEGRYEVSHLPAGQYTVSAIKDGFVEAFFGQDLMFQTGRPLHLANSEVVDRVDLALLRGGVITGRILDEDGEPVPNATVQALPVKYASGRKVAMSVGPPSITWDDGQFRVWGLKPGEYVVSASPSGIPGASIARTDRMGYAPSYYPRTANPSEARPIGVGTGQIVNGITVTLLAVRTANISGTVVDAHGQPAGHGTVPLMPRFGSLMMRSGGIIRPDGTFTLGNVPPGDYVVRASIPPAGPSDESQVTDRAITINGEDIGDLRLAPPVPVTVKGRLILGQPSSSQIRPSAFRVAARPRNQDDVISGKPPNFLGVVQEDYTFAFKTIPGRMLIQAGTTEAGGDLWSIRAVRLHGKDITDSGIDIQPGEDISGVEIELTSNVSSASGVVRNGTGSLLTQFTVIVFPQDRDLWRTFVVGRNALALPEQGGRFHVRSIRPGDYFVAALEYVDSAEASDSEYLERLSARAAKFSVAEGEMTTLDITLLSER